MIDPRKLGFALVAVSTVVMATAVTARADGERLAFFTKNKVNPNYIAFRLGADRAAARLGATTLHRVPEKPDDAPEQIALLATTISERPSAILLAPADDKLLEPAVEAVNAAKIPIIGFVNRMAKGEFVSFVGSDDVEMGYQTARFLLQAISEKGNVVILEGTATAPTGPRPVEGISTRARGTSRHSPPGIRHGPLSGTRRGSSHDQAAR